MYIFRFGAFWFKWRYCLNLNNENINMNNLPKAHTKTELLEWLNDQTSSQGISVHKIEDLGNGVGYLTLLGQLHPGVLGSSRFIR